MNSQKHDDIPPSYSDIVLRSDPPEYKESIFNEQINPEINKKWALDIQRKSVAPEVEEAISRSREVSLCVPEDEGDQRRHLRDQGQVNPHRQRYIRRNTFATIEEHQLRLAGRRVRTSSFSPPIGGFWIGV